MTPIHFFLLLETGLVDPDMYDSYLDYLDNCVEVARKWKYG